MREVNQKYTRVMSIGLDGLSFYCIDEQHSSIDNFFKITFKAFIEVTEKRYKIFRMIKESETASGIKMAFCLN